MSITDFVTTLPDPEPEVKSKGKKALPTKAGQGGRKPAAVRLMGTLVKAGYTVEAATPVVNAWGKSVGLTDATLADIPVSAAKGHWEEKAAAENAEPTIEPDAPVGSIEGFAILSAVMDFMGRYLVLSVNQLLVIGLWTFHTWAIEAADSTPYLAVTSSDARSGKSRVLEVMELLVKGAQLMLQPSEATIYRQISMEPTTLLLDEIDSIFGKDAKQYEGIRGILNGGHRRGAVVPRISMDPKKKGKVEKFQIFCPKMLAGIGALPDTLRDRSIQIRIKRRTKDERIQRLRFRVARAEGNLIRDRLFAWASDEIVEALREARPLEIRSISDRMDDAAEPLIAIAETMGIGAEAREAIIELCAAPEADDQSIGIQLLTDIRAVFVKRTPDKDLDISDLAHISSASLVDNLNHIESAIGWGSWFKGKGITVNDVAKRLKPYGITPRQIKDSQGVNVRGYKAEWFAESWKRYCKPIGITKHGIDYV